jgi:hypothetical protein
MVRFNILIPFPLLTILAMLGVVFYVTGYTGVTVLAVIGALSFITAR